MTDRLRVLLVTTDFPPTLGGIQTMAREICARAGAELRVVAPADPGHDETDPALDLPVRRVARHAGLWGLVPALTLAARAEARRWRPDVVLALHVLAAAGGLAARVPTVVFAHGGEFRSTKIRRVARAVLPRAARVLANSRYTRSAAVALGADPMRTSVLLVGAPEPVEVPPERVAALRGDGRLVLCVARLEPHKGQDALIRAAAELPGDVRVVLVGRGKGRAALAELARAVGVDGRVTFAGSVGDDELPAYYSAADAFALLSRETGSGVEGGGIALLEAAAYGLPIVAGASGGVPESVRDGETGLLVDPSDGSAVVRALSRVLTDVRFARRLGEAARAMATGERSWKTFVERLEHTLEIAAGRGDR